MVTPGGAESTSAAPVVAPVPDVAPREAAPAPKKSTPAASSSSSARPGGTYTVKRGDTLSEIAQRAYGSASKRNIDAIKRANGLKGDTIRIGQKLKIPSSTSATPRSGGNKD
jgi:LysM repeat protein